jgi:ribosomal protein L10
MTDMTNRLVSENMTALRKSIKEEKSQGLVMKQKKQAMITEIKGFIELYQTFTINEYDYWNYKDAPMFSLFVEKFEKKAQDLDGRSN